MYKRFLPTIFLLPTNHTNLHEALPMNKNGDLFGRTNFHEFNIWATFQTHNA